MRVFLSGGPATLSIVGEPVTVLETQSGKEILLPQAVTARSLSVYVTSDAATVSRIILYEQSIIDVDGDTVIRKKDVDSWRNFIIRHPRHDKPCYMYATLINGQTNHILPITIDSDETMPLYTGGKVRAAISDARKTSSPCIFSCARQ
jgi:hypothetical protein